jgi:hypothetical protein
LSEEKNSGVKSNHLNFLEDLKIKVRKRRDVLGIQIKIPEKDLVSTRISLYGGIPCERSPRVNPANRLVPVRYILHTGQCSNWALEARSH